MKCEMKSVLPKFESGMARVYSGVDGIWSPETEWTSPQLVPGSDKIRWITARKFHGSMAYLFRCETTGVYYLRPHKNLPN